MSFETDWDVEQYRHHWDSDDQWEVRRHFMLAHKGEIPEAKLVCLAQVYANIEFLQCSYPAKVMEQVRLLAVGLDETALEKRRQKQSINFVKAKKHLASEQDINPEKQKRGRWEMPADANRPKNRPTASSYFASSRSSSGEPCGDLSPMTCSSKTEPQSQYSMQQSYYTSTYYNRPQNPPVSDVMSSQNLTSRSSTISAPEPLQMLPPREDFDMARMKFNTFIIFQSGNASPLEILRESSKLNGHRMEFCESCVNCPTNAQLSSWRCLVKIDGVVLGEGVGEKKVEAKKTAAEAALELLRSVAYTLVKNNAVVPGRQVTKGEFEKPNRKSNGIVDQAISDDNIGNKLLRLMGWSGSGGLGKAGKEGIAEPIKAADMRGREGLGAAHLPRLNSSSNPFVEKAKEIMHAYASEAVSWDLVFSNDFSKEERSILHRMARKFGLKSGSKGKEAERFLVISQPKDRMKIVEQLIRDGGSNEKYSVIPPLGKPPGSNAEQSDQVETRFPSFMV